MGIREFLLKRFFRKLIFSLQPICTRKTLYYEHFYEFFLKSRDELFLKNILFGKSVKFTYRTVHGVHGWDAISPFYVFQGHLSTLRVDFPGLFFANKKTLAQTCSFWFFFQILTILNYFLVLLSLKNIFLFQYSPRSCFKKIILKYVADDCCRSLKFALKRKRKKK